ncbi:hypothetical protein F443_00758 [Phytophthora nicotianae P1569]|uniref:Uncharacterized protein n=1 Tax=Phytophthora nicotianae P1569 TaxID=1317065 RepID=V9G0Q4_PHYNI|nr:hypothetical protein F443_00758 [Phytophthora nicotianae P1569]
MPQGVTTADTRRGSEQKQSGESTRRFGETDNSSGASAPLTLSQRSKVK